MAVDGYMVNNITSNADNKQNVLPIENFVAVTKSNIVIVDNNANLNNNNNNKSNALSWHIPRPSLISSQENSVYTSNGSSVVTDYHHHAHPPPTRGGQRGGYQNFRTGRGSTSTQGSSSSNNSTQSAKSGSLLLTVANLAKIDQEHLKIAKIHDNKINHHDQHAINLQYYLEQQNHSKKIHNIPVDDSNNVITSSTTINPLNTTTINNNKGTKDIDTLSIASSTHFTVVNGLDRYRNKISQNNSCCRKHKLTVLTLTMSSIFMFGIIVAVYLFEMRAMHLRNS